MNVRKRWIRMKKISMLCIVAGAVCPRDENGEEQKGITRWHGDGNKAARTNENLAISLKKRKILNARYHYMISRIEREARLGAPSNYELEMKRVLT
jgi:hypothetical protein